MHSSKFALAAHVPFTSQYLLTDPGKHKLYCLKISQLYIKAGKHLYNVTFDVSVS